MDEITETIAQKAHGMFRWAVCQLDAFEDRLNVSMLRKSLDTLPKSLDDMYFQALAGVTDEHAELLSKVLQWLAYSTRPLYTEGIAEIVTVNMSSSKSFDPENRLLDFQDIIRICPSILVKTTGSPGSLDSYSMGISEQQLLLAHFSVKQYLLSDKIRNSTLSRFAITEHRGHFTIAADCLAYIMQFNRPYIETPDTVHTSPLLRYATHYWWQHVKRPGEEGYRLLKSDILGLFRSSTVYANWTAFLDEYTPYSSDEDGINRPPDPLYYAASYGLPDICKALISTGSSVNSRGPAGTALAAACFSGELGTVQTLVDNGADVDASGPLGSPLMLAVSKGYSEVVDYLLRSGADVRYGSETGETPLVEAQKRNYPDIVRLIQLYWT